MSQRITMKRSDQGIVPKYCQLNGEKDTSSWRPHGKNWQKERGFPLQGTGSPYPTKREVRKIIDVNVPAIVGDNGTVPRRVHASHCITKSRTVELRKYDSRLRTTGKMLQNRPNKNSWWPYVPGSKLVMWEMVIQPLNRESFYEYIYIYIEYIKPSGLGFDESLYPPT